jgi:hypothetical protein
VVWLNSDKLVLEYQSTLGTEHWETQLMALDLVTGSTMFLPDDIPPECHETSYGRMSRLPSGQLGYLRECFPHKGVVRDFRLHVWDFETYGEQYQYQLPLRMWATQFSFSTDLYQWLQEGTGDGIFNNLHLFRLGEEPKQLLTDEFERVGHPVWLANDQIYFAGTPRLPENRTNIFSGLPGLRNQLMAPWHVYATTLSLLEKGKVSDVDIILKDIVNIKGLTATSDGTKIAFLGTYYGNVGLWLYDVSTQQMVRIWDEFGPFAWSPDGAKIIVLIREPGAEVFAGRPAVIELPAPLIQLP